MGASSPSRSPVSRRDALIAAAFLAWALLVAGWYYGSERRAAAIFSIGYYLNALFGGEAETAGADGAASGGPLLAGLGGRALVALLAAGVLAAAAGFGARVLGWLKVPTRGAAERLAWGGAIGLGLLSFAYAVLGMLGLFNAWMLAGAALVFLVVGGREFFRLRFGLVRFWRRAGIAGSGLALLVGALALWRMFHCFAPPLLGEADYDALEYHLAAPMEWLRMGRVAFLPHNVYADMPAGGEMLYAPGLALLPGNYSGYYFAKLMGLGAATLAALAVYAAGRRIGGRRAGVLSAAVFFSGLWLADLLGAPFVEPFLILYATVAWSAFAVFAVNRLPPAAYRLLVVAGLAAGAAAAAKYPAAVFIAAPLGLAALAVSLVRFFFSSAYRLPPTTHRLPRALAALALVGGVSLALAAPWYAKNWLADGNPVYPLASRVFPSRHWDEYKDARFRKAHAPKAGAAAVLQRTFAGQPLPLDSQGLPDLGTVTAWHNLFLGLPLLLFLPLAPFLAWGRRRRAGLLLWTAGLAGLYVIGWASLTHQIERFLYPALGAAAVLAGAGAAAPRGRWSARLAAAALLGAALLAVPAELFWTSQSHARPARGVLTERVKDAWASVEAVNALPAGSRVLLVGEARPALFRVPTVYAVVFDTHPLEAALAESASADELAEKLRALGVTHVYCNWSEFLRLRDRYAAKLPDGTAVPGLFRLAEDRLRVWSEFERGYLEPAGAWDRPGASPLTGRPAHVLELWRVKP